MTSKGTVLQQIKAMEPIFLQKAKRGGYICPKCLNGSGPNGTGIMRVPAKAGTGEDGTHYKCFKCGLHEDTLGLWKIYTGAVDMKAAMKSYCKTFHIGNDGNSRMEEILNFDDCIDNPAPISRPATNDTHTNIQINTSAYTHTHTHNEGQTETTINTGETEGESLLEYFKACAARLKDTDYLKNRGISTGTVEKFPLLGYDPSFKGSHGKTWKALIIPTSPTSYVARNIEPGAPKDERYKKKGPMHLYSISGQVGADVPLIICEGEIDTLSIVEAGGEAIGLGSTANYEKAIEALRRERPRYPVILALDNDESGEECAAKMAGELKQAGVPYKKYNLYGQAKDANEALLADRAALAAAIHKAYKEIMEEQDEKERAEEEAKKEEYMKTSAAGHMQDFIGGIADSVNTPCTPTGFKNLDTALDGGLYEGLYTIGAIPSLGKTTLALQIADNIAMKGRDVLIFSLEMARNELMAKSISRLTWLCGLNRRTAKTARGITDGSRYKNYSPEEKALIKKAMETYAEYAGHIFISEGMGDIGVPEIRKTVETHISFTGQAPVVIVDYIQIMAPADVRGTDKQNMDKAILELKRLSRDEKMPVIAISSFNRQNYKSDVAMEAFKESGAIEYSADVLIGLQMKKGDNPEEAKKRDPREVELVVLKNRNGKVGEKVEFEYYPYFNYFKEV